MKKRIGLACTVLFLMFAFSIAHAADEIVNCDFNFTISAHQGGKTIISFEQYFTGKGQDGFLIGTYDETGMVNYFLPEGQKLILDPKHYWFWVNRAFKTEKGMVIGVSQTFDINPEISDTYEYDLGLAKYNGPIIEAVIPQLWNNVDKRNYDVRPFAFSKNEADYIYVSFVGGYHNPKHFEFFISKDGGVVYPMAAYGYLAVASAYLDKPNHRMILSVFNKTTYYTENHTLRKGRYIIIK